MDFTVPRNTVTCNWDLYFLPSNICLCIKWLCLWPVILAPVPRVFLLRQKEQTNLGICHSPTFLTSDKVIAARCPQFPLSLSLLHTWIHVVGSSCDLTSERLETVQGHVLPSRELILATRTFAGTIFRHGFPPFLELNLWYCLTPTQTFVANVYTDLGRGHVCTVAASNPLNNSCWSHTATSAVWIHAFKSFWQFSSVGLLVGKCILLLYFKMNY